MQREKNKKIAALLALIGGTFGIHKFYLDDAGSGIFYIVLAMIASSVFPITTMLGLFDAFRLITMSDQMFDAKHNKEKFARDKFKRETQRSPSTNRSQAGRTRDMERGRYRNEKTTSKKRANPFRNSGDKKFKEYDLDGALADYTKAMEISPADKHVHFNLACIYSLKENTGKSLFHLEEAINRGLKNIEKIKSTDELAFLRIQPEFDSFVNNGYVQKNVKNQELEPPKGDLLQDDRLLSQLNKLKELRSKGLLSEKEFSYEKEKLTNRR